MDTPPIETDGFVEVRTRPDLSYDKPSLIMSPHSLQFVRERSAGWSGIHRPGVALSINALFYAWMMSAARQTPASITCRGTAIADVRDPETDKDGIGINAIDEFTCSITGSDRIDFRFEALIGEPIFGGGIPGLNGLKLIAGFEYDRKLLHNALFSTLHGRPIA